MAQPRLQQSIIAGHAYHADPRPDPAQTAPVINPNPTPLGSTIFDTPTTGPTKIDIPKITRTILISFLHFTKYNSNIHEYFF